MLLLYSPIKYDSANNNLISASLRAAAGTPYEALSVGVPAETYPDEKRVSISPTAAAALIKKGKF